MLTGHKGNFVRIPESQYAADIASAEARGRAASVGSASTTSQASPTMSETERLAGIDALAIGLDLPQLVTQMKQDGIPVSIAACEIVKALASRKAGTAGRSTGAKSGDTAQYAAKLEDRVAKAKAEGRPLGLAQAAAELQREEFGDATAKFGTRLDERIAKAKAQGRRIGLVEAAAELQREDAGYDDPAERLGAKMVDRIEKAKARGIKLGYPEAAAEVLSEESGATVNLGAKLEDRIAKAKADGRIIGPVQAMAELQNAGEIS